MTDLRTHVAGDGGNGTAPGPTVVRKRAAMAERALPNGDAAHDGDAAARDAELTALAAQLQDARDRQKTLSATLENVLDSTGIATIVLDPDSRIRFFTPATRQLFNMLPGDIGRPVFDLASNTPDPMLADDIAAMHAGGRAEDRLLRAGKGTWFNRRVQPFRGHDDAVNGVVVTYLDVSERKAAEQAAAQARAAADAGALASARFLSAASHDLRQPLQTLVLLQELLASKAQEPELRRLVTRLDLTLDAMTSLLDGMLDRSRVEAGAVDVEPGSFALDDLLRECVEDVGLRAQTAGIELRRVKTSLHVRSDRRLLATMIRNLLINALKYTIKGGVLIGARRRGGSVRIEVWDTGVGIPEDQHAAILSPETRAVHMGSSGVGGLGLSVVRNMAAMLGHPLDLKSRTGTRHGSMFAIVVPQGLADAAAGDGSAAPDQAAAASATIPANILVIDDDADVLDLLRQLLAGHGHAVVAARDEAEALAALTDTGPDLIIADLRLLGGRDGLTLVADLRARLLALHARRVPAIILTGDVAAEALDRMAAHDIVRLAKPVRPTELHAAITGLLELANPQPVVRPVAGDAPGDAVTGDVVHVIDDDADVREQLGQLLAQAGLSVVLHASSAAFRANWHPDSSGCLLIDAMMPGESGLDLLRSLKAAGTLPPAIMITGQGDVTMAVAAMKSGAVDFIEKPAPSAVIIASIKRALAARERQESGDSMAEERRAAAQAAAARLVTLTPRQREVMAMVLEGHPSKNIAADLKLSQRTVENHRAEIMHRSGCRSLPELARLVMIAQSGGALA
ncbi:MAG: response regulator [Sphingomonadales bacterium]